MIQISEFSRQKIRSISKVMNVGKVFAAQVVRVDTAKKFIDLSKTTMKIEDMHEAENKYQNSKLVQLVCRKFSQHLINNQAEFEQQTLYDVMLHTYSTHIWKLYTPTKHAYDVCKDIASNNTLHENQTFVDVCKQLIRSKNANVFGVCTITYFGVEGVDKIKEILGDIKQRFGLQIQYFTKGPFDASQYRFLLKEETEENNGVQRINEAMKEAQTRFNCLVGGQCFIEQEAHENNFATVSEDESDE
jgi:translation initiation factor 2 alpha subunit (eIF-2alpha)